MKITTKSKRVLSITGVIFGVSSIIHLWLFYVNYFKWAGLFNSEGRYFDENESVVYLSQDSILIVPAILFMIIAIFMFWHGRRLLNDGESCKELIKKIRSPWTLVNSYERKLLQEN